MTEKKNLRERRRQARDENIKQRQEKEKLRQEKEEQNKIIEKQRQEKEKQRQEKEEQNKIIEEQNKLKRIEELYEQKKEREKLHTDQTPKMAYEEEKHDPVNESLQLNEKILEQYIHYIQHTDKPKMTEVIKNGLKRTCNSLKNIVHSKMLKERGKNLEYLGKKLSRENFIDETKRIDDNLPNQWKFPHDMSLESKREFLIDLYTIELDIIERTLESLDYISTPEVFKNMTQLQRTKQKFKIQKLIEKVKTLNATLPTFPRKSEDFGYIMNISNIVLYFYEDVKILPAHFKQMYSTATRFTCFLFRSDCK